MSKFGFLWNKPLGEDLSESFRNTAKWDQERDYVKHNSIEGLMDKIPGVLYSGTH